MTRHTVYLPLYPLVKPLDVTDKAPHVHKVTPENLIDCHAIVAGCGFTQAYDRARGKARRCSPAKVLGGGNTPQ